jgi:hypothetical protein
MRLFCEPLATNRKRGEITMSPFCLIDVAGIREHAEVPHDVRQSAWHKRLGSWMSRVLHGGRG